MMTSKDGSVARHAEPDGSVRPPGPAPGRLAGRPLADGMLTRRTSLSLPPQIPLDEWSRIGHEIFVISESSTWWLGDWLIYGQAQYPDRYMHAIAKTSLELASLPEEQQEMWLDRAEKFSWSRNELRNRVRASRKAARAADDEDGSDVLSIEMNVPADRKQRWLEAASTTKQDLLSWIVSILDNAADTVIGLPGEDRATSGQDG